MSRAAVVVARFPDAELARLVAALGPSIDLEFIHAPEDRAMPTSTKHPAAVALGKLGGSRTSPRKAAASRANGKKGGHRKPATPARDPVPR